MLVDCECQKKKKRENLFVLLYGRLIDFNFWPIHLEKWNFKIFDKKLEYWNKYQR